MVIVDTRAEVRDQAACRRCGAWNQIRDTFDPGSARCVACGEVLRGVDLYKICFNCQTTNRIVALVGTKAMRCGNAACREDLATPVIVDRLVAVRDALTRINDERRYWTMTGNEDLFVQLRREQALLGNLSEFPGYGRTRRACFGLATDIDALLRVLEPKLSSTVMNVVRSVVRTALAFVHITFDAPRSIEGTKVSIGK